MHTLAWGRADNRRRSCPCSTTTAAARHTPGPRTGDRNPGVRSPAAAIAAATTGGTAAYRRVPARHGYYVRLAAAIAAAFTAGAITDGLLDLPGSHIRHRLNGLDHSTPPTATEPAQPESAANIEQAEATPERTDADMLRRLEEAVAADAAIRAASHGWCRAIDEKLLTSSKHWHGHSDGTASLPLVAGCTLHFEPHTCAENDACPGDWRHGPLRP
ncbi:hypothetical protein ACWF9B_08575 [Streptomyces sp. NPDC055089]